MVKILCIGNSGGRPWNRAIFPDHLSGPEVVTYNLEAEEAGRTIRFRQERLKVRDWLDPPLQALKVDEEATSRRLQTASRNGERPSATASKETQASVLQTQELNDANALNREETDYSSGSRNEGSPRCFNFTVVRITSEFRLQHYNNNNEIINVLY